MRRHRVAAGLSTVLFLCATGIAVSGCATTGGIRADNQAHLLALRPGMTQDQVLAVMGTKKRKGIDDHGTQQIIANPYRTESYKAGGSTWLVLFYYTDIKSSGEAITDDDLTPLVLKDGTLDGWGWMYWKDVIRRYEIRIR